MLKQKGAKTRRGAINQRSALPHAESIRSQQGLNQFTIALQTARPHDAEAVPAVRATRLRLIRPTGRSCPRLPGRGHSLFTPRITYRVELQG